MLQSGAQNAENMLHMIKIPEISIQLQRYIVARYIHSRMQFNKK